MISQLGNFWTNCPVYDTVLIDSNIDSFTKALLILSRCEWWITVRIFPSSSLLLVTKSDLQDLFHSLGSLH